MFKTIIITVLLAGCATAPILTKAQVDRQTASDEYDECLELIEQAMEAGVDIPEQCTMPKQTIKKGKINEKSN